MKTPVSPVHWHRRHQRSTPSQWLWLVYIYIHLFLHNLSKIPFASQNISWFIYLPDEFCIKPYKFLYFRQNDSIRTKTQLSPGTSVINTLRPGQDGRLFKDDIFTCIFINENYCILIKFSLKYVRKDPIDNNPALVQIMAWCRSGYKSLAQPMMVNLLTHIYASLDLNELRVIS